jgi:hypothetical protein
MMDNMTASRPKQQQRQLLLVVLLFLVSQLALALHSHDLSLHSADSEECVVCLVTTSDDPAPVSETPVLHFPAENSQHLPALNMLASEPPQTPSQPRAPPYS